ncbi:MAG: Glycerol-3-phosphate dehydrogenase [NAD(P)+] [Alphaproteobacteria bacterium MarineAlpha5_Bin3]|nr:MAG: Glycerol-3-phosphate dehydrogenase [NAD(P)+] [Alphaproteobacteria bacterium MarineAlpha5_Bin3]
MSNRGALKNVYAIAAGMTQGLNLGENAKSALITRSFVEISRFGEALGAKQQTIFGLSGLGDLILTCNSLKSRNTSFGQMISSMSKPDFEDILKSQEITEGYYTVKAVKQITDEKKIDMPIMQSVYNILYNSHSIKDEIKNLLERPITDEFK